MRLVEDWKKAWKWFSTWLLSMTGVFVYSYENLDFVKAAIPDKWFHYIVIVLCVLIFAGRIIKQGESNVPPPTQ